ncbi:WAP four-disulfide core domain protein 5-like [Hyperolius riggenbachi]|uniref:WAP four-disulfide core domain protein 5-like n=1 Tax=Hyperolius riggenbachi TaxID=752182 RepID=UPI0035A297F0
MRFSNQLFSITFLYLWIEASGLSIKTSVKAKPGSCPKSSALQNSACDKRCSNDMECPNLMKCCDSACGRTCLYAERPGFCPDSDLPATDGQNAPPKCVSDFGCIGNAKCCDRGATRDCLPALKEKPGICPGDCGAASPMPCSSDHDCPAKLKCCPKCGQKCTVPIKVNQASPMH